MEGGLIMSLSIREFTWRTADGRNLKIREIGDDHLRNILKRFFEVGKDPHPSLKEEYKKRNLRPSFKELRVGTKRKPTYNELLERLEKLEEKVAFLENIQEV